MQYRIQDSPGCFVTAKSVLSVNWMMCLKTTCLLLTIACLFVGFPCHCSTLKITLKRRPFLVRR